MTIGSVYIYAMNTRNPAIVMCLIGCNILLRTYLDNVIISLIE